MHCLDETTVSPPLGSTSASARKTSNDSLADFQGCLAAREATTIRLMLERRHSDRLTLQDIAEALKMSPFRALRIFQRHVGLTPHSYLVRFRVHVASELLLRGEAIASVATQVGFVDQSHMTRHFKRILGITPCKFRDACLTPTRSRSS